MDFLPKQKYTQEEVVIYYAIRNGAVWCESANLEEVYRSAQEWDTDADTIIGYDESVSFHRKTITHHTVSVTTWEEID